MEILKDLSQDRAYQLLVEPIMLTTFCGAAELLESTRREFSFDSEQEEDDEEAETAEEETEEMDLDVVPLRFQGHLRPRRFCPPSCVVVSAGGARRVRLRTRTTSSTRTCKDSGDGGVVVDAPCDHAA